MEGKNTLKMMVLPLLLVFCSSRAVLATEVVAWGWNDYVQCTVPEPNEGFVTVAGGDDHSLGIKADGSIVAWGRNDYGQCTVPGPNEDFIAVAGGLHHSLGLKADGSIAAWGYNDQGQCNVPEPNEGFVAVAGGWGHSLGLKADGSIAAWGYNFYGQCNVPEPNSGFIAVAGNKSHNLGLKEDGSIVAWGWNDYGQCNVPEPNEGFVAIAAGDYHSLGLKEDGSITAWGHNSQGQCNVPLPNSGFIDVAAGGNHTLGLKAGPTGTAFTYQGRLLDDNSAADEPYDLQFELYNNMVDGIQQGTTVEVEDIDVIDGYFTVQLDFGSDLFNGLALWLEIGVRPGDLEDPNEYTTLSPRQEVRPTPYAIYADKTRGTFVDESGNVGIGTTNPVGKLDVNGSIYQRGVELYADYVFETGYELESIEEHSRYMWDKKHLRAIPVKKFDENGQEIIEVGAHRKGIVEELEKAHIYIEQLHKRIGELQEQNGQMEGRIEKLEAIIGELGREGEGQ